ncbi:Wadjet anti-phage system protein JetA family protein [Verrucomicrobiota bacterium sgz303538]
MLSPALFREVPTEFFGILASRNAPLYVDALDALARAFQGSSLLPREEAVEIVAEVLRAHPEFRGEEEFPNAAAEMATLQGAAGLILRRLTETRWLHEPQRADFQRLLSFEPNGELVLAALRQVAHGEPTQFTDQLGIACGTLMNPEAIQDDPFADIEGCMANVEAGLRELRQMQKGIERHTKHLLSAQTLRENLSVLYDEFCEQIGHACYRELVRSRLPSRILRARQRLGEIAGDEEIMEKMQRELLRRRPMLTPAEALSEVRLKLDEMEYLLASVEPQAEEIDRRTADFARRSFARFRYLQEMNGGMREKVQAVFSAIDQHCAGQRFNDAEPPLPLPPPFIPEAQLLSGDSLFTPRLRRSLAEIEPIGDDLTEDQCDDALREMEANLRDSMNVLRANTFVASLPVGSGEKITTAQLPLLTDDDLADVIACLLHASARDADYTVEVPHIVEDAAEATRTRKIGYLIDDFVIEKR